MSLSQWQGFEGSVKAYLREIGHVPLLSVDAEREVAARSRDGDPAARDLMIRSNLRLVITIARQHAHRGMPIEDLIAEGNLGLLDAVEKFDPDRPSRFASYAGWWISKSIHQALANNQTIRVPEHITARIIKMRRVSAQMTFELGRPPTEDELAEELGLPVARVEALKRASFTTASLDAPVGSADDGELRDLVSDSEARTPLEETLLHNQVGALNDALLLLPERQRHVIAQRFGLGGTSEKTLEEIASEMGCTRERVRQLEVIALRKLRRIFRERECFPKAFSGEFYKSSPTASGCSH